jgi:hypothetical protein
MTTFNLTNNNNNNNNNTLDNLRTLALSWLNNNDNKARMQIIEYFKTLSYSNKTKARKETTLSYLGSVNSSSKIEKNKKLNYDTFILYLLPHSQSGYNTCSKASEGCVKACLNESGRVILDSKNNILVSRLLKTLLFYANRNYFNSWIFAEIETAKNKSKKTNTNFSVRLNGTSDLNLILFKKDNKNVLEYFSNIQFYDYTKVFNRLDKLSQYKNYHLTFSHSGENNNECKQAIEKGYNIAIPFLKELPKTFNNLEVINADETDLRFLDKNNVICGLKVKRVKGGKKAIQYAIKKGFVVDSNKQNKF